MTGARHTRLSHQLSSFAVIGVASTLANVVLFYLLNLTINTQLANALALIITTVFNTAANRRYTFGVRTREGAGVAQLQGLVLWLIMWAMTALALWLLARADPHASHGTQSVVQFAGNVVATIIRFVMLRKWFAQRPAPVADDPAPAPAE
ncbi:GtrA family protein [Flexivirga oryzae]|uniref:Putative flippase GtrA n=1 Tax=Flexivirga oryzae TaxID=1794944 RepID=A0A839N8N4_9MICO|nr:GtrA family protein [Flexivirga oryzae]MBB2893159.1 putative flippase GtrA [Flexivirga oryzae]